MITFSISYDTILFSLLGLLAMLVVIMAVALWLDYRAGVFTPELEPCFMCGVPSDKFLCFDCHANSAIAITEPELVAVHEYKFEHCSSCNIKNPYVELPCNCTNCSHNFC